jgi:5-methylcytosine-specific restriction endonuclease McrBC regulatory subunit McrC
MIDIDLIERADRSLTSAEWRQLSGTSAFWSIVRRGVVSVTYQDRGTIALRARNQVGRFIVGEAVLDISPKVAGAVEALLSAAEPSLRLLDLTAPATRPGDLMNLLVRAFLARVRAYATVGREWTYIERRERGSLIGGRVDVTATASLRARGVRHQVAFRRPLISRVTDLNLVIYSALAEVNALSRLAPIPGSAVSEARGLSMLFEDCATERILDGGPAATLPMARRLLELESSDDRRALLELASTVLAHLSFEPSAPSGEEVPLAWLVNMEVTFERALISAFRRCSVLPVAKGATHSRFVLPDSNSYRVDPDLAIGRTPCAAVGDAKYKTWGGHPDAADVYQLVAHARALETREAFLVYAHEEFDQVDLGITSDGIHVRVFAVDVRDVADGARRILTGLGVPVR